MIPRVTLPLSLPLMLAFGWLVSGTASAAFTPLSAGDTVRFTRNGASGGSLLGGEFRIQRLNESELWEDVANRSFSFCIELNETIVLWTSKNNRTYKVADLSDGAKLGGNNGVNGSDPLEDQTKYLFSAYSNGDLDNLGIGFSYGAGEWADALQASIWSFEENYTPPGGSSSLASKVNSLIHWANSQVDIAAYDPGLYGTVYAVNLTSMDGTRHAQDQLYWEAAGGGGDGFEDGGDGPADDFQPDGLVPGPNCWAMLLSLLATGGGFRCARIRRGKRSASPML